MSEPVRCAPWDFSAPIDPRNAVPNVPTELGALAGRELARLTKPALEEQRRRFPDQAPPCNECAFVEGTVPNRSPSTVMDALKAALELVPFYCHKGISDGQDPKRVCAGLVAAISTFDAPSVADRLAPDLTTCQEPSASPLIRSLDTDEDARSS